MSLDDELEPNGDIWSIHDTMHTLAKERTKHPDFTVGEVLEYPPQAALDAVDQEYLRQRLTGLWIGRHHKFEYDREQNRYRIVSRS